MQFRTKIFVASVVAAIVSLVASELWLSSQVRDRQLRELVDHLTADARIIGHHIETSGPGPLDFDSLAHEMGRVVASRVTFVAADGVVLGDSTQSPAERAALDNHSMRPEVVEARANGFGRSRRYSDTVLTDMLYVAVSINHPEVRFVRLARPTTEIDEQIRAMRRLGLVAVAVGVPLAFLVAWVSTVPLARRMQEIARVARAHKAGDFAGEPRDFGTDELGTVAHTLDEVARELARRVADLSQDRARIDAIVAGMVEGVLVVDHEGRIQRLNSAAKQLLGIGDIALGQPFGAALRDPAITEQLSEALRGEGEAARELPLRRDSSRTIVARASAVPTDRGGGAVLVLHDISDIRRADRMRQDFVANVSHELRTPLTVIRGYAEALADGSAGTEDAIEFGTVITRHATRMERLVADLLRLARLDAQQETVSLAPCEIETMFAGVVQDLRPFVEAKRQHVTVLVAPGAGTIMADAAKIHDVLRNLVDNAVTYAPEGAEIRLEAWASDGTVRLTVADNGPGIPPEALPRIFERFYRVDPSRARPGGTGLGLAIVKHLVELLGGSVSAANSALGGAVFTVVLPSRVAQAPAGPRV